MRSTWPNLSPHGDLARWFYRGGRPNRVARVLNRASAIMFSTRWAPRQCVTLEVRGRQSGRMISFPLVVADVGGERYLVSMLGERANWVANLRASGGRAVLRGRRTQAVHLRLVAPELRAPILKRYLKLAPGARPHIPVDKDAPLCDFDQVAAQFPVFQIEPLAG